MMKPDASETGRIAAFFDVDRTLIAGATALHLSRPMRRNGLVTRRSQLRAAVMQMAFMLRGADDDGIERFNRSAREIMAGWKQSDVERIINQDLERSVRPVVYSDALERIEMHRRMGHEIYAVSATLREIVEGLTGILGLDGGIGSRAEIRNGIYTGEIAKVCHGEGKADRIREFIEGRGFDLSKCYAYSDSISDEPMLRMVGKPYAVNPDKSLRRLAVEEGWGVLFFRKTERVPLHRRKAVTAAGFMAALGLLTIARRRK